MPGEPGERFCGGCGTQLPAPAPAPPAREREDAERKPVTVLFADVAHSMELAEQLEDEEWSAAGPIGAAGAALHAGNLLAVQSGGLTYAAFLAEERARLDGTSLSAVAADYDAIGATGHARRIRAEQGPG